MTQPSLNIREFSIYQGYLDRTAQVKMIQDLRQVVAAAPLFQPKTPAGRPLSVRMTSAGRYGWYSDRAGYRYEPQHPSGVPWPPIPAGVLQVWRDLVGSARLPDCCLLNYYTERARMGLHQDKDEADFAWPVVSISLGDEALFRVGNVTRGGKTESIWLGSGDVVLMGGDARLAYHGVDRIRFGSSDLLSQHGRINLTLRVVD